MTSTTGSSIDARDFNQNTADPNRNLWTAGQMRHLVAALGDTPVVVVAEKRTGHTMVGVRLTGVRQTPGYGTFQVCVERDDADGVTRRCWHPLFNIGTVVILGDSQARWTALRSHSTEYTNAKCKLYAELVAEHGKDATSELNRGAEWSVGQLDTLVDVYFRSGDRQVRKLRHYRLSELAEATTS